MPTVEALDHRQIVRPQNRGCIAGRAGAAGGEGGWSLCAGCRCGPLLLCACRGQGHLRPQGRHRCAGGVACAFSVDIAYLLIISLDITFATVVMEACLVTGR